MLPKVSTPGAITIPPHERGEASGHAQTNPNLVFGRGQALTARDLRAGLERIGKAKLYRL
jgi:hypothetical protein